MTREIAGVLAIGLLLVVLFAIERGAPLRSATRPLLGRLLVNAAVAALSFAAALVLVRPAALAALAWTSSASFGLIHVVPLPPAARFALALVLLDLTFYWWHVATHRIPLLWRFHLVHHIDPDLDVSTAFRFHLGEVALSAGFRVVQVVLVGPSAAMFAAYEVVFQAGTLFHHSNLRLPLRLERALNLVIVTPRMHGIHHSQIRDETNSNYSVVFSWWDRLHRTIRLGIPQSAIAIGVPGYTKPEDNTVPALLAQPFRAQRRSWPAAKYLTRSADESAR